MPVIPAPITAMRRMTVPFVKQVTLASQHNSHLSRNLRVSPRADAPDFSFGGQPVGHRSPDCCRQAVRLPESFREVAPSASG